MENLNLDWVLVGLVAAVAVIALMLFVAYGPLSRRKGPSPDDIRLPDELQALTQTRVSLVGIIQDGSQATVRVLEGQFAIPAPDHPQTGQNGLLSTTWASPVLWQWGQNAEGPYNQVQMQVAYAEVMRVMTEAFVQVGWKATDKQSQHAGTEQQTRIEWVHLTREAV